ncbi:hypothetical protein P9133_02235 [Bacillus thuringiensis]|uniref:PXO1-50 n=1 Tax=Bacillus thuringiensis HD-771 TaxID=1218175 RepID=A0A9W3JH28_BACTU|nr:hypothetical protein [Bacillus thuringiensis]AFQ19836.1 hypothetical protein BTG_32498 [Bacillus thuringiensis HD-771]MEC3263302.1 hypothetical protein [Bacillus thuringiensis]MEC3510505.1 hypothetical protein [Bacillus thuringiensis]MED2068291.1 hypothetical protein [Bacillus thuringiensis]MED2221051.1 hypothetical protein [Bacillus thuringiensis]
MNEIINESKERFEKYCKENTVFETKIDSLINYYFLLLADRANILQDREFGSEIEEKKFKNDLKKFETLFPAASKNAFLKGYQLGLEFLRHPETVIPDALFTNPNFVQDIPFAIVNAAEFNIYELIRTDETQEFSVFAVRTFEGIKPLMEQIFSEIALYGAEIALDHEREEKGLEIEEGKRTTLTNVPIDRLFTITPSITANVVHAEKKCEIWNLNWNARLTLDNPFVELAQVTIVYKERTDIQKNLQEGFLYEQILFGNIPLEEIQDRFEIRVKYSLLDNAPRILEGFEIQTLLTELLKKLQAETQVPFENMVLL